MKKDLSKSLKIFYGIGDLLFTLMSSIEGYFFTFFLTNLARFPLATVAFITTVASTIDACISWVYGAILNSVKPMKYGRYRSWLILLPWTVPFIYAFQFMKIGDGTISIVIIIVATVVSHMLWNIGYVANVSMISVAAKTPEDRSQLAATRGAWSNVAKVIFAYVVVPAATLFAGIVGEVNKYAAAAFVFGIIMAVGYFIHFKMFDGYEETGAEEMAKPKADQAKTSVGDLAKTLFTNVPLLMLILADLSRWMFNFVLAGIAIYYFKYVAQAPALYSTYIMIVNLIGVVGAYTGKFWANKLSTRTAVIMNFIIMTVALVICKFAWATLGPIGVIVLLCIGQYGYGANYSLIPALFADCVVYGEWKTGKNASGWIMGLQNLPLKVAIVTRGIIISACLAAANFDAKINPADATQALKDGIANGFFLIPAIATLISVLLLVFGFKLTKEKVLLYQSEINSRKN